jgi:hypothetical protein
MTAIEKKEYNKQWRLKNKELIKEYQKKYRIENKEKTKEYHKQYRENNKEKIKEKEKKYRIENKEKVKERSKNWKLNNKEKQKETQKQYYLNNESYRIKARERSKKWQLNNLEKLKESRKIYQKNRRKTDSLYKLSTNFRSLIGLYFRKNGYTKKSKCYEILQCSFEHFKEHIEKQFTNGMNWGNQGQWHLDHIYPVSKAKDEEHLIKLNHYTNFQPLWAEDNLKKSNKILC